MSAITSEANDADLEALVVEFERYGVGIADWRGVFAVAPPGRMSPTVPPQVSARVLDTRGWFKRWVMPLIWQAIIAWRGGVR